MPAGSAQRGRVEQDRASGPALGRVLLFEASRLATRRVTWAGAVVLACIVWVEMAWRRAPGTHLFGQFTRWGVGDGLVIAIAAFVGVATAGSLAADRQRGYPSLVLIRGVSRSRYLAVKAVATAAVAGSGVAAACVLGYLASMPVLAWGASARPLPPDGPYPMLLAAHPLASDVVLIAVLSFGAGALALSGLAFGALMANEYLACAVPLAMLIVGIGVFRVHRLLFLGPYTELSLSQSYTYAVPRWAWAFTAPAYWAVFALVCVAIAAIAIHVREEL